MFGYLRNRRASSSEWQINALRDLFAYVINKGIYKYNIAADVYRTCKKNRRPLKFRNNSYDDDDNNNIC